MLAIRTLSSGSVRMAEHFLNFDIFKWLYLSYCWVFLQTWGFCNAWSELCDYVELLIP